LVTGQFRPHANTTTANRMAARRGRRSSLTA
jgi:hypothetical protein